MLEKMSNKVALGSKQDGYPPFVAITFSHAEAIKISTLWRSSYQHGVIIMSVNLEFKSQVSDYNALN